MIQGLYAAASGLDGRSLQQDAIAENLAHINVPGYRRRGVAFAQFAQFGQVLAGTAQATAGTTATAPPPTPQATASAWPPSFKPILQGTQLTGVYDDFQPGPLQQTGNPLDVAATGNTFFILDGPNGPLYTRNGTFELNTLGELTSHSGLRVRGEGGPIAIPPETRQITISEEGVVQADGVEVGRLQLQAVATPRLLQRVGTTLFTGPQPAGRPEPGTVRIVQGFREGSNVLPVTEMVNMIAVQRYYEAAQRAMLSLSDALALDTRPQV